MFAADNAVTPLVGREDVILTPHLGASSAEAQHNVAVDVATQICDFLEHGVAHNAVNIPALPAAALREMGPYVRLAEKMGSFLAQRSIGGLRKLEITLAGEIAKKDTRHLTLALLVGALKHTQRGVNMVNAPLIAKERGLRTLEGNDSDTGNYQSLLKVRASTRAGEESHVVSGTVFGREPRFVRIDNLFMDFAPRGPILITEHADRPGVIGELGTALGRHEINIRRVELGAPRKEGDPAAAFFSLYSEPSDEVLESIRAIPTIQHVQLVHL